MTLSQLKTILPYSTEANREKFFPYLIRYMADYGIDTPMRMAQFWGQIGHESGSLKYVEEIASGAAYEGRKDLGNTQVGDGKRFKGRGLIQITGRYNYEQMSKILGKDFVSYPELLMMPQWAVQSACAWWSKNGLNEIADTGDVLKVTKKVNGGTNGLADRTKIFEIAKKVFGA